MTIGLNIDCVTDIVGIQSLCKKTGLLSSAVKEQYYCITVKFRNLTVKLKVKATDELIEVRQLNMHVHPKITILSSAVVAQLQKE